jgi:hypothetical protein
MSNTSDAVSSPGRPATAVTPTSATAALIGLVLALFGVYWDDAWHTDRGRDSTLSAPHIALYAGVALAVGVVIRWGWHRRSAGGATIVAGPVGVAVMGAGVTLGSAPIDAWWHEAFGRDAVVWSPPHLIALLGTISLASGLAMIAGQSSVAMSSRAGSALSVAAGAGVLGGWQVLVLEYDTDVAQFSPLWYLPVLAAGLTAGLLTVQVVLPSRLSWPATRTGLAYTAAVAAVAALLWAMDFSRPIVPVIVPALAVADVARRRGWSVAARSWGFVVALFAVYVPYLRVVSGGVSPSTTDALLGIVIAAIAVAAVIIVFDPTASRRLPIRSATVLAALTTVVVVGVSIPGPALAHDPGQGDELSAVTLVATVTGDRVDVRVDFDVPAEGMEPERIVARRAGRLVTGPLGADGDDWSGRVDLDDPGRWFVYVEARAGEDRVEAWIPVMAGDDGAVSKSADLYLVVAADGPTGAQVVVGGVLVVLSFAIVVRIAATVRSLSRDAVGEAAVPIG